LKRAEQVAHVRREVEDLAAHRIGYLHAGALQPAENRTALDEVLTSSEPVD
jgi:hypothetical protein